MVWVMQVNVPDRAVRFLIGKQGQTVSALEKQSKAKVEFAKVGKDPPPTTLPTACEVEA